MNVTPYDIALRFVGVREAAGAASNPMVLSMLRLDGAGVEGDDVPWCSAFVNYVAWLLRLPRSKSLRARSWLNVGTPVPLNLASVGYDVVVTRRGANSPGADVINAPGHVGFFGGYENGVVLVLAGNQGDEVSIARFPESVVLGVRRLS